MVRCALSSVLVVVFCVQLFIFLLFVNVVCFIVPLYRIPFPHEPPIESDFVLPNQVSQPLHLTCCSLR